MHPPKLLLLGPPFLHPPPPAQNSSKLSVSGTICIHESSLSEIVRDCHYFRHYIKDLDTQERALHSRVALLWRPPCLVRVSNKSNGKALLLADQGSGCDTVDHRPEAYFQCVA